jgi:hypothetical protein
MRLPFGSAQLIVAPYFGGLGRVELSDGATGAGDIQLWRWLGNFFETASFDFRSTG